jgi:ElaB/YqjD/DUF883 family membrane-anchored ribosome-binding protein
MNTGSAAAENMREAAKEAREAIHEARKAASESAGDLQKDIQALRDDFRKLAEKVGAIFADKGGTAWRHAKAGVDEAVSEMRDQHGAEATVDALRDVSEHFAGALDESIKTRPYTTLALAAGLGFLLGAVLRG